MKYRPKHILEYTALLTVTGLMRILPLRAALALGWLIAASAHFIGRVNVERTYRRVREVLGPETSRQQLRRIAWISARNFCFNAVEAFRFNLLTPEKIRRLPLAHVEQPLKNALNECDGGYILATPHMGNWEMGGLAGDLMGLPLFTVVRKQRNPLIDAYLNKMRGSFDLEILYRDAQEWKGVVDRLRQGRILAILPDIRVRSRGITVDYLNGKATIAAGTAHFALLADCPVYPVVVRRTGWCRHDAVLLDPVFPNPDADRKNEQKRIMQELMSAFSREILKTPEQYFWYNKRWVLDPK
jgi:KDO2-lipid IV(A) lauroyltransferase